MKVSEEKTYYELLGVDRNASAQEIKAAYHDIAKVYHPDSNFYAEILDTPLNADQVAMFKLITEAYHTLTNKDTRARYDASLLDSLRGWDDESNENYMSKIFEEKSSPSQTKVRTRKQTFGCGADLKSELEKSALETELEQPVRPGAAVRAAPRAPASGKKLNWISEILICVGLGLLIGAALYVFLRPV